MKVVRLLQDMSAQLQSDLEDDQAVHSKLDCWCKENDQDKTQAIEVGAAKETELESFLGEAAARMAQMKTKRDATLEEVDKDEAALQEARAMRMKEKQGYQSESVNLKEGVDACAHALVVLGAQGETASGFAQVRGIAQRLQDAHVVELAGRRGHQTAGLPALRAFLAASQAGDKSFLSMPPFQSYGSRSGKITGVLSQMKEGFERDLAEAEANEKTAAGEHSRLKSAKEAEISSGRKSQADLDERIAELNQKHAQAFKDLEGTQKQLGLDREFLASLKQKCSQSDEDFDRRVQDRQTEIVAVQDTIAILNDDAAFENFDNTVNTPESFLQVGSSGVTSMVAQERLAKAAVMLTDAAAATGSMRLALVATRSRLDAFEQVQAEIDKMVVQLDTQQADEIQHRDLCIRQLQTNKRYTASSHEQNENLQTQIADHVQNLDELTKDIEEGTNAVAEMQNQMKRASENREAENGDFQKTVIDQRLTQAVLNKALNRMKQVYNFLQDEPQAGAAHIHTSGNHTDAGNGPARFTKYEENKGGSKVVALIGEVLDDAKKTEAEAIQSEQEAQSAYENFMKDSNKNIRAYSERLVNYRSAKAVTQEDHSMANLDRKGVRAKIVDLQTTGIALHKDCDFLMDNFDDRQAARVAEVDALKDAKAILSGMK